MKKQDRTKEQLIKDLTAMRQRVTELEELEFEREQVELALQQSRSFAEAIIQTIREPLVVLDAHLTVLSANWSFCDTFQVTLDETVGASIFDLGDRQWDIPALRTLLEDVLPGNTKFDDYEVEHVFPFIGYKIMLLNARRIYQEGTGTQKILLAIEDITERRRSEQEMKASETRYRRLFETAQDGILILEADTGEIRDVNPFLMDMLGYTCGEFLGKQLWEIGAFKDIEASKAAFKELQTKGYVRYEDLPLSTRDGREIAVEFVSNVYPVNDHKVIQCNIRDITDRKRLEEKLQNMSLVDDLTGLYNRRGFFALAEQQLKIAARTREKVLLFFTDLDNLKHINDTLGHQGGDSALVEIAAVLRATFRKSDIIGRMGGDEFAILAVEASDETRQVLAQRLKESMDARNNSRDHSHRLSLSTGIASYDPKHPLSLDELMAQADTLMYEEKRRKQYQPS